MMLIAEGLEGADQVVMLQGMDCDAGQGYFFSRGSCSQPKRNSSSSDRRDWFNP